MNTNVIIGLAQVLVPFFGQLLISKGIIPAETWTQIGAVLVAIAASGWSAGTTTVSKPGK